MNLDDAQQKRVADWVTEGLKLSDIQKRLADELGLSLTYMEVRFLVDDLKLKLKDSEPSQPADLSGAKSALGASGAGPGMEDAETGGLLAGSGSPAPTGVGVKVKVDQVTRAGALVSGSVTFSDGKSATWFLDQYGRLGMAPGEKGYKPSAADVQTFQIQLQGELAKLGY
jgi:hypothetical protein